MAIINTYASDIYTMSQVSHASLLYVLTEDAIGGEAVYWGIVDRETLATNRAGLADLIAGSGTKMRWRDALIAFPSLTENSYRA